MFLLTNKQPIPMVVYYLCYHILQSNWNSKRKAEYSTYLNYLLTILAFRSAFFRQKIVRVVDQLRNIER